MRVMAITRASPRAVVVAVVVAGGATRVSYGFTH